MFNLNSYKKNSAKGSTIRFKHEAMEILRQYKAGEISKDLAFKRLHLINGNVVHMVINTTFASFLGKEDESDLYQAGLVGFIVAMERFDPEKAKGCSFFSYAKFWVFKYIYEEATRAIKHGEALNGVEDIDFSEIEIDQTRIEIYNAIHAAGIVNFEKYEADFDLCIDISSDFEKGEVFTRIATKYKVSQAFVKKIAIGYEKNRPFSVEFVRFIRSKNRKKDFEKFMKAKGFLYRRRA